MAGKSDFFENALLQSVFGYPNFSIPDLNTIWVASAGPLQNLYISLHTADPTDAAANQSVNECSYTGYARKAVPRGPSGFTITGNSVSPAADIDFPSNTGGTTQVATHFAIGTAGSGSTGKILYSGTVTPQITINQGTIPRLTTFTTVTED